MLDFCTRATLIPLLVVVISGCNGLFYYPDSYVYSDPTEHKIIHRDVTWTSKEGQDLRVWELLPTDRAPIGTVLHFHGNAQNRTAHFYFVAWLTKHGYRVVTFDYRGYGGSPGKPSRAGLVADGSTMITETCRRYGAQPVFILAQSLGGAVAVPSLTSLRAQHADNCVCAVVLESTFASYRHLARVKLAQVWLTWPLQFPLSFLVSDELSPVDSIAALAPIPLLMIHGDSDPVVPFGEGQALFQQANNTKEFWTIPSAGHTPAFEDPKSPYRNKLVSYFGAQSCLRSCLKSPSCKAARSEDWSLGAAK